MPAPARQVCPLCGLDDSVASHFVDEQWRFVCDDPSHVLFEWIPTANASSTTSYRNGVAQDLGVYDALLECVDDRVAEYGVIEHRFAERERATYDLLVRRYGHTATQHKGYSTSAFLGGALGQLWREEAIDGDWYPATGYWSYNGMIGGYVRSGGDTAAEPLSWATFAADVLGVDPHDWPALGFDHRRRKPG